MSTSIFTGTLPALMTPCKEDRTPDFDALVRKAQELMGHGMSAMIYCGSMGDWPLLTDAQRMEGVERLVGAGIPVIVGTGAINTRSRGRARRARAAGRRQGPDGDPARALARLGPVRPEGALQRDPLRRARARGRHLQQPVLRLRDPRRPVLRAARRSTPTSSASRSSAATTISATRPRTSPAPTTASRWRSASTPPSSMATSTAAPPARSPASATSCRRRCCT